MSKELMYVREAARELGVHENTVRRMMNDGHIEYWAMPRGNFKRPYRDSVLRLKKRRDMTHKQGEVSGKEYKVIVHEIKIDGLPDMDKLTGKVAFIWDGNICSGWPTDFDNPTDPTSMKWETADNVLGYRELSGVTHWVELPIPVWEMERTTNSGNKESA